MDTRFWGPSGWRLLHLIAATPIEPSRRQKVKAWFELLEYVLPCKYCRASFHDYMELQPLTASTIAEPTKFSRWIYDIHNRVNGKLRGQGLLTTPDPAWPKVRDEYKVAASGLCKDKKSPLLGWDFMTSVAFTTPPINYRPVPMPDMPEDTNLNKNKDKDRAKRNRYNLLSRKERITALSHWWRLIPSILPCAAWRSSWNSVGSQIPLEAGREAVMRWMWSVEERVCASLQCPTPHPCLSYMKKEVSAFESDCGKSTSKRKKTCRTRKHRERRQVLTRRKLSH